jgi:hypothetical protein
MSLGLGDINPRLMPQELKAERDKYEAKLRDLAEYEKRLQQAIGNDRADTQPDAQADQVRGPSMLLHATVLAPPTTVRRPRESTRFAHRPLSFSRSCLTLCGPLLVCGSYSASWGKPAPSSS